MLAQGHLVCGTGQMFLLCFLYVTQRCGQSPPEVPDDGWSPQFQKFVFKFPQTGLDVLKEQARKSSEDAQAAGYARFEKVWAR